MSDAEQIARRRTFAIISHPDAGKTTLTEKLLLFGGAIQLAGEVKARGDRRRARSDWMAVERERGISVSSAVMSFEHEGLAFNLLDTPGHQDFSEDTYRTLTAADSALESARGTRRQLSEVCRLARRLDATIIRPGHSNCAFVSHAACRAESEKGCIDGLKARYRQSSCNLTGIFGCRFAADTANGHGRLSFRLCGQWRR